MIKLALLRALVGLAGHVPVRTLYLAADLGATLAWFGSRRLRATTRDHMRHVLPATASRRQIDRAARGCLRSAGRYYVDFARYAGLEPARVWDFVDEIEGVPEVFAAYDRGCGLILTSAHLGNPEFIAQALAPLFDTLIFTEQLEPPAYHEYVHAVRRRAGVRFVPVDPNGVREAVRHLRAGKVAAALVDRDVTHSGAAFPFFGERAPMPRGAVELAWLTGAPVIVGFVTRTTPGRYRVTLRAFELPTRRTGSGDRRADLEAGMRTVVTALEAGIREAPDQWFALSPIWSYGLGEHALDAPSSAP